MYHSLIGKPSVRVGLVMGFLIVLSVLLLAACGGENPAKGGAGQEHKKSTSGGTASTDGLIVFRRYLDLELTMSAVFTTLMPAQFRVQQDLSDLFGILERQLKPLEGRYQAMPQIFDSNQRNLVI